MKRFVLVKLRDNQERIFDNAWYSTFNPLSGESHNYYVDENYKVHIEGSYFSESNETIYDDIWTKYDEIIGDYITSEDNPLNFIKINSIVKFGNDPQLSFVLDPDNIKDKNDVTYIQLENQYFEKIENPGYPGEENLEYDWKLGDLR